MRRAIGITLTGLGAFLFASAILIRFYAGDQVIRYPPNESLTTVLQGNGFSYFSPSLVRELHRVTMRATSTTTGDPASASSSRAMWGEVTNLYDVTNGRTFETNARRFAFDRRTAELINCCGASVNGDTTIRQSGLVGFLWPFGTQKKTYQVFDPALNAPRPARYAGTSVIGGISAYRFVEHVPPARVTSVSLPASLAGMPGSAMVTLSEMYTGTNTFWVDPVTGAQLSATEDEKVTLNDPATGVQRLVVLDGTLVYTPATTATVVRLDSSGRDEYTLLMTIIPLSFGLGGLAALAGGIVLARSRRAERPAGEGAPAGEDTTVPAPAPVLSDGPANPGTAASGLGPPFLQ